MELIIINTFCIYYSILYKYFLQSFILWETFHWHLIIYLITIIYDVLSNFCFIICIKHYFWYDDFSSNIYFYLFQILLSSSAHAQPRLSNLCGLFLKSLVGFHASNTSALLNSVNIKEEISTEDKSIIKLKKLKTKKILAESFDWAIHLIDDI